MLVTGSTAAPTLGSKYIRITETDKRAGGEQEGFPRSGT